MPHVSYGNNPSQNHAYSATLGERGSDKEAEFN